jgi:hypothetical protein
VLAVAIAWSAAPAAAEVLLTHDGRDAVGVEVRATARGPWTPLGRVTPATLNPAGDAWGDGSPGVATRGHHALVAWVDHGTRMVEMSLGTQGAWQPLHAPWRVPAVGVPRVVPLLGAWSVVWQDGPCFGGVWLGVTDGEGEVAEALRVAADAYHVGTVRVAEDVLHVVSLEAPGAQLVVTTVAFVALPDAPVPVPVVLGVGVLAPAEWLAGGDEAFISLPDTPLPFPVALDRAGLARVGRHAASPDASIHSYATAGKTPRPVPGCRQGTQSDAAVGTAALDLVAARLELHDGARPDGSAYALVTWWPTPQELRYVELDQDGMVLPVESIQVHGNAPYAQGLVHEAVEAVRSR